MILTYICFEPNSLTAGSFVDLISGRTVGFTPTEMRSSRLGRNEGLPIDAASLATLGAEGPTSWIRIDGIDGSLQMLEMGRWPLQVLILNTPALPGADFLEAASRLPGFSCWVTGDANDVFWQSADQTNTYDVHGLAWDHLPTVNDPIFDRPKIDISANVGRAQPIPGMWLWAGAEICFGAGAFKIFDRARVLGAPSQQVTERDDGSVVISLYQTSDDLAQIRQAQQAFRTWLDYDGVASQAASFVNRFRPVELLQESDSSEEDSAVEEAALVGQLESWSRLYAITDILEQVIARYSAAPAVRMLAATLLPVISDIKAGRITEPIGVEQYPSMHAIENETNFADYVDVVNAHSLFREEVTVGSVLSPQERQIIEQMEARRIAREKT